MKNLIIIIFMLVSSITVGQTDSSIVNFIKSLESSDDEIYITNNINDIDSFYCYKLLYERERKEVLFLREDCDEKGTLLGYIILSMVNK